MKVYLVEISGTTVRAFADKAKAELYVSCLRSEWDDELNEFRYGYYDIDIAESYLEK